MRILGENLVAAPAVGGTRVGARDRVSAERNHVRMSKPENPDGDPDVADVLHALDLQHEGAGRWLVETASRSRHLVTTDGGGGATLTRTPDPTFNQTPDAEWRSAALRRDEATLRIIAAGRLRVADDGEISLVPEIRVGFPAIWVIEPLAEDAAFTTRTTTDVVSIARLPGPGRGEG